MHASQGLSNDTKLRSATHQVTNPRNFPDSSNYIHEEASRPLFLLAEFSVFDFLAHFRKQYTRAQATPGRRLRTGSSRSCDSRRTQRRRRTSGPPPSSPPRSRSRRTRQGRPSSCGLSMTTPPRRRRVGLPRSRRSAARASSPWTARRGTCGLRSPT